jgi:hypothetical protein
MKRGLPVPWLFIMSFVFARPRLASCPVVPSLVRAPFVSRSVKKTGEATRELKQLRSFPLSNRNRDGGHPNACMEYGELIDVEHFGFRQGSAHQQLSKRCVSLFVHSPDEPNKQIELALVLGLVS